MDKHPRRAIKLASSTALLISLLAAPDVDGAGPLAPNRTSGESNRFVLMHAHGPVDWYPWGEQAFAKARRERLPIFLWFGDWTCRRCRVMEREVFSRPDIAALMNQWFVNVVVDADVRPDLTEIYASAGGLLHITGYSTLFLTPELELFAAGEYFPPEDPKARKGFPAMLRGVHDDWTNRRAAMLARARKITATVRQSLAAPTDRTNEMPSLWTVVGVIHQLELPGEADLSFLGFRIPPPTAELWLLWETPARVFRWAPPGWEPRGGPSTTPELEKMVQILREEWRKGAQEWGQQTQQKVLLTLRKMGESAIYDQAGGGFFFSTSDQLGRVPVFEKRLSVNAQVGELLVVTAHASGDADLARLARGTLDFACTEMTKPGGAFAAAVADEGDSAEGSYFTWSVRELHEALGPSGFALLAPEFGFDAPPPSSPSIVIVPHSRHGGRGEHESADRYSLYLTKPFTEYAARLGISRQELLRRLQPELAKLLEARRRRPLPFVDDEVFADTNGMMIAALARGGKLLGEPRYLRAAVAAADFVLTRLRAPDGTLLHTPGDAQAYIPAFLDDYAFFIHGLLALDEATGDPRWRREAERLAAELERRLRAPLGGYYMSGARPDLLFQTMVLSEDAAEPTGNGVAVLDLLDLASRTGNDVYLDRAQAALRAVAHTIVNGSKHYPTLLRAVARYEEQTRGRRARSHR
jgi:hypothetical protein